MTNPLTNKFCGQCGTRLIGAEPSNQFTAPERYTPRHLAEEILASKTALEGERKQVTVLFADLKGSMELLGDRDPEEVRKVLDPVLERMMDAVHRFEGTVNQVMGDGIMALFGAPLAHEDHAVRACYAALQMQQSVKRYSEELRRAEGVTIQIRVGINSGEVVVRSIGSDLRMDYSAVGQTTHLAARMEQIANPGTILLTREVMILAEGLIQVASLGPVGVKGLSNQLEAFELVSASHARSRFQAATARGLTPYVGRNAEIELLHQGLERARGGRGQLAAVVGEPGVGKSRLVWEFMRSDRTREWLLLHSSCVSYGTATIYSPVIEILKNYFQVEPRDDADKIREKFAGKLWSLDQMLEPALPAPLALLDVSVDDPEWAKLDPSQRRRQTLDGIRRLILRESQIQPVLLILEDLHWIDSETQALLDALVEILPTARILLLMTYRPEYLHSWASKTYYQQLRLDVLSTGAADELLDALLGRHTSLGPLKHSLIERTEGNPFFLEEAVRALLETGTLLGERGEYRLERPIPSLQLPTTAQAVVAARIDRLAPDDKRLLQSCAVVGKDVSFSLLQAIAAEPEVQLRARMARLQRAELLYQSRLFPDLEYTFKHALTHEVAYGTLLAERRRAIHSALVTAHEQVYADRLTEHVERLAHHSVKAELWPAAVQYLRAAGTKAVQRHAAREAMKWFDQALVALSRVPASRSALEQGVDIRLDRIGLLTPLGDYRAVHEQACELEQLAQQLGDELRCGYVYRFKQNVANQLGRLEEARAWGNRALDIARRFEERPLRVIVTTMLEQTHFMLGEYQRVVDLAGPNLAALPSEDERLGYSPTISYRFDRVAAAYDRGFVVRSLAEMGRFREALQVAAAARQIAEKLGDPFQIAWTCYAAACLHNWMGRWGVARSECEHAMDVLREAGLVTTLANILALSSYVRARLGEATEASSRAREAESQLNAARAQGRMSGSSWSLFWLCRSYLTLGQLEDAERVVDRVLEPPTRASEAHTSYLRADIAAHLERPQYDRSEECYWRSIDLADTLSMRPLSAHCRIGLARLFDLRGRSDEARAQFSMATTVCRDLDMQPWLQSSASG